MTRRHLAYTGPLPAENGQVVRVKVTSVGDQWSLAACQNGGLTVEPFGEPYADVRKACRDAAALNARSGS